MSFPLVPLPAFLVAQYPNLANEHQVVAGSIAILSGFFGLFIIMMHALNSDREDARGWITMGFLFLGVAGLACVFGLYFAVILFGSLGGYLVYSVFSGARLVLFGK